MAIEQIHVAGYRSIRNFHLNLGQVNLILGPNGCGKTNLYRAVYLLQAAAGGALARTLAEEGGMPSVTWAGERYKNSPVRVTLGVTSDQFEFELSLGLPIPGITAFGFDPVIKEERLWFIQKRKRTSLLERNNSSVRVRDADGNFVTFALTLEQAESSLSEVRDPLRFPILAFIRQQFVEWRFYHQFRTDPDSPIRKTQVGSRTFILSADGRDLAAALQTIRENGDSRELNRSIQDAFPSASLETPGGNSLSLGFPEFGRPFGAGEISDGTLKYLCLVAALLTPRPPSLMVFNEPEASLHPDLMAPLARLIARAAENSQLLITTHSEKLAAEVEKHTGAQPVRLEKIKGETVVSRTSED